MFSELRLIIREKIDSGESVEKASAFALNAALSDPELNKAVLFEAIQIACKSIVMTSIRDSRGAICKRADAYGSKRKIKSEELKDRIAGLLQFRLPGGKILKESTSEECREAALFYNKIAETNRVRGSFLMRVATAAKGKIVGDAITEEQCEKFYKEAKNESFQNSSRAA